MEEPPRELGPWAADVGESVQRNAKRDAGSRRLLATANAVKRRATDKSTSLSAPCAE